MSLNRIAELVQRFRGLNAKRVFFKQLAENDNSKQQIYLGGNFEVLPFFPYGTLPIIPKESIQTSKPRSNSTG
ncbi:MAG: hypothetical protein IPP22_06085 [Nitrosomonas sp.]|nr:hypothetical protein [Nitrosomonas sp.]